MTDRQQGLCTAVYSRWALASDFPGKGKTARGSKGVEGVWEGRQELEGVEVVE